jgi:hypothetical protein
MSLRDVLKKGDGNTLGYGENPFGLRADGAEYHGKLIT